MRIAICDDDPIICNYIEKIILDYTHTKGYSVIVQVYNSGTSFICDTKDDFDLVFLDIELNDMTGVEVGKFLRNNKDSIEIVFISAHPEYALELFKIRPVDFLTKPFDKSEVEKIIEEYYKKYHSEHEYLTYKFGSDIGRIRFDDILYISSYLRKISIHKTNGENIEIYAKLDDIEAKIPKQIFWRIHKSYIVNIRKVELFQYETMKLENGEVLTISKAYRRDTRAKMLRDEELL